MSEIKNSKQYIELYIPVAGFDTDILSGQLHRYCCLGILEAGPEWCVYLPGEWTNDQVSVFLDIITRGNSDFRREAVRIEKLAYRDWNSEWRKYFQPLEVLPGWWIRPPWLEIPEGRTGQAIIIDPQMAFGTGHHETTRLMLQAMSEINMSGLRVLDLGTGSGILAIFARMCQAQSVTGIDIDPEAIANARHNSKLNAVDGLEWRIGDFSLVGAAKYPLILANIQYKVLGSLGPALAAALADGGTLIVSGVLLEEVERLAEVYQAAGLLLKNRLEMLEWAALVFEKQ